LFETGSLGPVWMFFTAALLLGVLGGGPLSGQALVSAVAFFFSVPIGIVGLIASSAPLMTPLFILGVTVLFNIYKEALGVSFYVMGLVALVVMTVGV